MVAEPVSIEKTHTTIAPPGMGPKITLLGATPQKQIAHYTKSGQYAIYREMFKQHPIVRGAIEKVAKYAVQGGYRFIPEDPAQKLPKNKIASLKRFFRRSGAQKLLRLTYKDLLIYGESFWYIDTNLRNAPLKAYRLHPQYMTAIINGTEVVQWAYGTNPASVRDDDVIYYDDRDVLHFMIDDPESDTQGLSLLHSLQRTVASDLNAIEFNGNYFENGAQTGIVFIMNSTNKEEADRNREYLTQNYVGTRNAHRPLLLEGGVTVESSVSNPHEMQFVEGRRQNREDILAVLDVPHEKVNVTTDSNRSTAKEMEDQFHSESIAPIQSVVEEEINNKLILERFGWDDVLFEHEDNDPRRRINNTKLYGEQIDDGVLSRNEVRAEQGRGPISGGDTYTVQTAAGLIPVELIDEVAQRLVVDATVQPTSGLGTDRPPNAPVSRPPSRRRKNDRDRVEEEASD